MKQNYLITFINNIFKLCFSLERLVRVDSEHSKQKLLTIVSTELNYFYLGNCCVFYIEVRNLTQKKVFHERRKKKN